MIALGQTVLMPEPDLEVHQFDKLTLEAGRPVAGSLQNVIKATGHAAMLFEAILFYLW